MLINLLFSSLLLSVDLTLPNTRSDTESTAARILENIPHTSQTLNKNLDFHDTVTRIYSMQPNLVSEAIHKI